MQMTWYHINLFILGVKRAPRSPVGFITLEKYFPRVCLFSF